MNIESLPLNPSMISMLKFLSYDLCFFPKDICFTQYNPRNQSSRPCTVPGMTFFIGKVCIVSKTPMKCFELFFVLELILGSSNSTQLAHLSWIP